MASSLAMVNFVSAFFTLIFGWCLGAIFSNLLRKVLKEAGLDRVFERHLKMKLKLEKRLPAVVKYAFAAGGLVAALTHLGIPLVYLYWALGGIALATLAFIAVSFKDWIPNMLAWHTVVKAERIKVGDTLEVKGVKGRVMEVNLIETKIETAEGENIYVPNVILKEAVVKR